MQFVLCQIAPGKILTRWEFGYELLRLSNC
jgi:hypothetical protein